MTETVGLQTDPALPPLERALVDHAFRVWATSRALSVAPPAFAAIVFAHGGDGDEALPAAGAQCDPHWHDGLPFVHPMTLRGPDHLAEIGHWVSARSELDATPDAIGRIPVGGSVAAALGADPMIPWASRHLDAFDRQVLAIAPQLADRLRRPGGLRLAGSHDIDFIPQRRFDAARRVARNVGVAALSMRDPGLVVSIARSSMRNLAQRRPLLGNVPSVARLEAEHGVVSTWNVLVRSRHARDAAYRHTDTDVRKLLDGLAESGHEIGLHGSYTSGETADGLAEEFDLLRGAGHPAVGHRHHWLRHDGFGLWEQLARAGARYDSSAGWSDTAGFRHGMAEPFIPFDLRTEAPAHVVEIPLVLMDVALSDADRRGIDARASAHRVLDQATRHGGAVSVLWHDTTVLDTQVRPGIGGLYAELLERGDEWVRSDALAEGVAARAGRAGLLLGVG